MTPDTIAAVSSAIAAFCSMLVTIWVVRYQHGLEDKRADRENRRHIAKFIEELSDACCALWMRVAFANLDIPKDDLVRRFTEVADLPQKHRDAFAQAKNELERFDDAAAGAIIAVIRGTDAFLARCLELAARASVETDAHQRAALVQSFERERGRIDSLMDAVGVHLVQYGATPQSWHRLPHDEHDYDPDA